MTSRHFGVVLSAIVLACAVASLRGEPALAGGSLSYPGDCATIQVCVDASGPGGTVFVTADGAGQNVSINKSVSLKSNSATHFAIGSVQVFDNSTAVFSTVSGLDLIRVDAAFDSSSGSSVIVRNVIAHGQAGQAATIDFDAEASASFALENSTVALLGNSGNGLDVLASTNGGNATFRAVGNRFSGHGNSHSGNGIQLSLESSGTARADIYNNAIWDVARAGGAGIVLSAFDTIQADVNLVGNTVEQAGGYGIAETNGLASGGHLELDMFNNTFSHASGRGVGLTAGILGSMAFRGGFNNSFGNHDPNFYDGLPKGPGNLAVDPKFVGRATGNLKLTSSSGLINKGQVCSPGGVADPDAANKHRLSGTSVDIGAFERGAGLINGLVFLGTDGANSQTGSAGADIMCGYGGMDNQVGEGGNDYMDGGTGNDTQTGNGGADRMVGGQGDDTLCANDGQNTDVLNGGKGNDGFKADSGDTKTSVEHAAPCL